MVATLTGIFGVEHLTLAEDAVQEALIHGGIANDVKVQIDWLSSEDFENGQSAEKLADSTDWGATAATFRDILFQSSTCCDKVLRLLARRVRELDGRLAEHTVLDLRHRLYAELLRLSVPRAGHPGERVVSPPPYHHVFAARIGCRREQVTREFTTMSGEGLVEKTRGGLVLLKPGVLEARIAAALRSGE